MKCTHFEAGSVGKALCESDMWLSNYVIDKRFRKLLGPTDQSDKDLWDEFLLPAKNQGRGPSKDAQEKRAATLAILWQITKNPPPWSIRRPRPTSWQTSSP